MKTLICLGLLVATVLLASYVPVTPKTAQQRITETFDAFQPEATCPQHFRQIGPVVSYDPCRKEGQ
jgi:hypothetical protein